MRIGFTGTRHGMTASQLDCVRELLHRLRPTVVRHGNCVGADSQFHRVALAMGIPVEAHPANNVGFTLRATLPGASVVHPARTARERNTDIVEQSDILIATPGVQGNVQRAHSGTWMTIRIAAARQHPCYLVTPEGELRIRLWEGAKVWVCRFCDEQNDDTADICSRCQQDRPTAGAR
jgi:hypothetical protein